MSLDYDISNLPKYMTAKGIRYVNELKTIRLSGNSPLQPIYEAFMNAWEALPCLSRGVILIQIRVENVSLLPDEKQLEFVELIVSDNGTGLTDASLNRLLTLRDDSKNKLNKGTGRVQFLHYFDNTEISSTYKEQGSYRHRVVRLSKCDDFLMHNAFVKMLVDEEANQKLCLTEIKFRDLLRDDKRKYYSGIDAQLLKTQLLRKFFPLLYEHKDELPKIQIARYCGEECIDEAEISASDIRPCDKDKKFGINFKTKIDNRVETLPERTEFRIRSFRFPSSQQRENRVLLVSKGAVAFSMGVEALPPSEIIDGERYLFLVSGDYIDENDSDVRGNLSIMTDAQVKRVSSSDLLQEKFITLEDIKKATNRKINAIYPEIASFDDEKLKRLDALKRLFLLDEEAVKEVSDSVLNSDTDEKILNKIYDLESKKKAELGAKLKSELDKLDAIQTTDEDYHEKLMVSAQQVVSMIPLQSKNDLAQYIARRKLVLSMFEKIMQNAKSEKVDEEILHNLFFAQHSNNPAESDMWILNEEFIYFNGCSENKLSEVEYLGRKLFKEEFSEEENRILHEDGQDRTAKRPDVLLFPEEGKCIIIEFKAPHVSIAKHLQQIGDYAGMLRNYTRDDVELMQFYGYLIGENINYRDVRRADSDFMPNATGDSLFRARKPVAGEDDRLHKDGTLYTEVIKYSGILERAQLRTRIFMQKLGLEDIELSESSTSENS